MLLRQSEYKIKHQQNGTMKMNETYSAINSLGWKLK